MESGRLGIKKGSRCSVMQTLGIILLLAVLGPSPAWTEQTHVRAGYFYNGDFMHKKQDGSYEGYDIEYYYTIAGYANWDVQLVEFKDLESAQDALERGDIDVMSGLSKTPERVRRYIVSSQKMCTTHIAVQTRADDDRFAAGDISTMSGLTCGILRGSNVINLYTAWCAANGLVPHIVLFDSLKQRNQALDSRQVDAIAAGSTIAGAQKIAEFPALDLFFMFNRKKTELKAQLDRAMGLLSLENPNYQLNLYDEYFPSSRNTKPYFSATEKAFIAAHPVIRVAVLDNDAPFNSAKGTGTAHANGILPRYFEHLSDVIGVQFECLSCASKEEAFAALSAGRVDMVGKVEDDIYAANRQHVILSKPYLKVNLVQIMRAGTSTIRKAAVPACNAQAAALTLSTMDTPPALDIRSNSEKCFAALKSGAVDSVICTQPAASWLLNRNRASDYVVAAFGSGTWDVCCAFAPGLQGNILRAILNRTILVDGNYIGQLIASGILEDSADLAGLFDHMSVTLIATLAAVAVALLIMTIAALIIIIQRRRTERELADRRAELSAEAEANKARHAFFGAVSHDMRTPLNAIIGYAGLAEKEAIAPKAKDYIAKIMSSGKLLSALIDNTLTVSKLNSGGFKLQMEPVRLLDIFEPVAMSIDEVAQEKSISFITDYCDAVDRTVAADTLNTQKILLNLLSNAVKYTPERGHIWLAVHEEDGPEEAGDADRGIYLEISVRDDGIGISGEYLPHIFDPFSLEKEHGYESSGGGLGLSIVKQLLDAMGGRIEVLSERGRGAEFRIHLHFDEAEEERQNPRPEDADTVAEDAALPLSGKKLLLCEDNALNREIAAGLLKSRGLSVDVAENGQLGLNLFSKSAPGEYAAVLLDIRMPAMDGYETAKAIRALHRTDAQTVPLIAMTADAFSDDVRHCIDAGMNAHIPKPVDQKLLFRTLEEEIQKAQRGTGSAG